MRFCSSLNTVVVGGFSKLLKEFRKNYKGNIISYCDRSISNGNVYEKNGFISNIAITDIEPSYGWTNCHTVFSKEQFQKYKLQGLYDSGKIKFYDENLSEMENMLMNKYRLIFDCGHIPYVLD